MAAMTAARMVARLAGPLPVRLAAVSSWNVTSVVARLPIFLPIISQGRHGVHPSQPDGSLITAQLLSCRGETFVQGLMKMVGE
jgi:hypothetical protein